MYYVRRCKTKSGDETFATLHGATGTETLCGKPLNEMWYVESSAGRFPDHITCKTCRKALVEEKE
jgi:hypothetical protein